jgi:hypothetical protein
MLKGDPNRFNALSLLDASFTDNLIGSQAT